MKREIIKVVPAVLFKIDFKIGSEKMFNKNTRGALTR